MSVAQRRLLPVAPARAVRAYVRATMAGRWRWLLAAALVLVAASIVALLPAVATGWITQRIVEHRGTRSLVGPVVVLAVAALAGAVGVWTSRVLLARAVLPEVARLREDVLSTALALPIDQVEDGGIGDLVARVSGDVERITEAAEESLGAFLGAAVTLLVTLGGLAALDWRFALAGLLAVPVQAHTLRWYLRESRPIYAAGRVAEAHRAGALLSVFAALPTVRAYRLGARRLALVEQASDEAMQYEFRVTRAATRFFGRLNGAEFIGLGAILLVGYVLVRHGSVSVGAATTAALFFAGLFNPINTVLGVFDSIQQATAALARLVGVTLAGTGDRPRRAVPTGGQVVRAEDIVFGYGDAPAVLHGVSVEVAPGAHVAVVGPSGSGKSSLAAVLAGVRRARSGSVTVGGVPVGDVEAGELRRAIALVTQESHVFTGTIADNLRLGAPAADDARLREALAAVSALDWIERLPDGLRTEVGNGAQAIAASQAQQLALARLLLVDPQLVILDEATAEAGSDAARTLDDAAAAVLAGRSAVIVAHRLTQAVEADLVLVLHEGVVVEQGTHDDLVEQGGRYAQLWRSWSKAN